jgi:TnpA family transposase
MYNYLIEKGEKYGIYQTDKTMQEVKVMFDGIITRWDTIEQIQNYTSKRGLEYVGFDMFYK